MHYAACIVPQFDAPACIAPQFNAPACIVPHCTSMNCTSVWCTITHCTSVWCSIMHCTSVWCTVIHCTSVLIGMCCGLQNAILWRILLFDCVKRSSKVERLEIRAVECRHISVSRKSRTEIWRSFLFLIFLVPARPCRSCLSGRIRVCAWVWVCGPVFTMWAHWTELTKLEIIAIRRCDANDDKCPIKILRILSQHYKFNFTC